MYDVMWWIVEIVSFDGSADWGVLLCRLLLATERCTSLTTDRRHVWTDGLDSVTHCDDSCHVISPLVINEMTSFYDKNEQDLRSGSPTCPSVADTLV
jgi:hypothetical protein